MHERTWSVTSPTVLAALLCSAKQTWVPILALTTAKPRIKTHMRFSPGWWLSSSYWVFLSTCQSSTSSSSGMTTRNLLPVRLKKPNLTRVSNKNVTEVWTKSKWVTLVGTAHQLMETRRCSAVLSDSESRNWMRSHKLRDPDYLKFLIIPWMIQVFLRLEVNVKIVTLWYQFQLGLESMNDPVGSFFHLHCESHNTVNGGNRGARDLSI